MAFYSSKMSAGFDSDRFKVLFGAIPRKQRRGKIGFFGKPGSPKILYCSIKVFIGKEGVVKMPITIASWLRGEIKREGYEVMIGEQKWFNIGVGDFVREGGGMEKFVDTGLNESVILWMFACPGKLAFIRMPVSPNVN